jgi:DME family drug/metabolite transporter
MIGELAALGAAVSWTISALLYRRALVSTRPLSANVVRLVLTCGSLLVFLIGVGKFGVLLDLSLDVVVLACVSGIIGLGVGDTLYMVSLRSIGVGRAVPITCTYPLFNLLWAVFLVGEPLTLSVVFGAVTIVLGIWLVAREQGARSVEDKKGVVFKGSLVALVAAVAWSVSITMINLAVKEAPDLDHAFAINTLRVIGIAASLLVVSLFIDRNFGFLKVGRSALIALLVGGIVALGIGWFFLTYSFTVTLESRAVPISSTTPLFSTLVAVALLHESLTVKNALGSVLIVLGIFMIFFV